MTVPSPDAAPAVKLSPAAGPRSAPAAAPAGGSAPAAHPVPHSWPSSALASAPPATPWELHARWVAAVAWTGLLLLGLAWELWLAPLRPGGSWLALKVVPLLPLLPGIWRGAPRALVISLLVVLLYVVEGSVRSFEPPPARALAWAEVALATLFFAAASLHLLPYRRAARKRKAARSAAAAETVPG